MSVVLLGMEMPRECGHCQLADPAWIGFCRIEKRFWNPDPGHPLRPGWCPLRLLPEKHEGLVFWKDGEPQCKIKRSDFEFEWPIK